MKESDVGWLKKTFVYEGVVLRGAAAWQQNQAELHAGWAKFAPPEWRLIPPGVPWVKQRKAMRAKGVRDPEFIKNQPFCKYGDSTEVPYDATRPNSVKYAYTENGDLVAVGTEMIVPKVK